MEWKDLLGKTIAAVGLEQWHELTYDRNFYLKFTDGTFAYFNLHGGGSLEQGGVDLDDKPDCIDCTYTEIA